MSIGYYVGLPLGKDNTHVTLALRQECEPSMLQTMIYEMKKLPLPIVLVIDTAIQMFGKEKDIPVHLVHFADYAISLTMEEFYKKFYNKIENLDFKPHVTVDSEEREQVVENLLTNNSGVFIAKKIELKKIGDREVIFAVEE